LRESIFAVFRSSHNDNIHDNHTADTMDIPFPGHSVYTPITPYSELHSLDDSRPLYQSSKFNAKTKNGQQSNDVNDNDSPIKGILDRFRPTHGIVFVAFHDIRDAQKVKVAIDASGASQFSSHEGDKTLKKDIAKLTCDYIAAEKLGEVNCFTLFLLRVFTPSLTAGWTIKIH
jgi:hypothetical protein